jgi:hypothetical protein
MRQRHLRLAILPLAAGALQGNGGLSSEVPDQVNLCVRERLHLLAVDPERADSLIVLEQRHEQVRPNVRQFDQIHDARVAPKISLIGCQVSNVDWRPAFDELREGIAGAYWMYEP